MNRCTTLGISETFTPFLPLTSLYSYFAFTSSVFIFGDLSKLAFEEDRHDALRSRGPKKIGGTSAMSMRG